MRALCPDCGIYHEVVRILDDGSGEGQREVYQVAPLLDCERSWISDKELFEAQARFGQEPIEPDDE